MITKLELYLQTRKPKQNNSTNYFPKETKKPKFASLQALVDWHDARLL